MDHKSLLALLKQATESHRQQVVNHALYQEIKKSQDLHVFMKYHVFAVWDFMCLLKTLQNNLTCISVPWYPKGSANTRYLINEIVVGEESDIDMEGNRISHFELYLQAMKQSGASTQGIEVFLEELKNTGELNAAFKKAKIPEAIQAFVGNTFEVIASNKAHVQAAVFTFGREDLIPEMFLSIINDIHKSFPEQFSVFKYYLERHIEVDGGEHSHLALEMTAELCGNDASKWEEASEAVIRCLDMRTRLWNGVLEEVHQGSLCSN